MQRYPPPLIAAAVALAAMAGFVDALAFSSLGGFFVSFMSGNTTRLGIGIGSGAWRDAATAAMLAASFVAGVVLSSVAAHFAGARRKQAVLALVTILLAIAAACAGRLALPFALLPVAVAMGAENGVFSRDGEVSIGLTYMTGTLVRLGQRIAASLVGQQRLGWTPYLLLWTGFLAGVVAGALAYKAQGLDALWLATIVSALLTVSIGPLSRGSDGIAA